MITSIITVNNLNKTFKDQIALKDVNVDFERGKIHGIIGRNGSGKTVLMKCICGLMSPTSGEIKVCGKRVGKDVDFPPEIGFIIETPGFLPNYSALKNLIYLASIRKKIAKDDVIKTINIVGLDPYLKKHVGKYSMGMRQRLGIAQAIMENPDILILDEPMNGLDNRGVKDIKDLFRNLRAEGKTILLASHHMEDITELCDTVCKMDAGMLERADGNGTESFQND